MARPDLADSLAESLEAIESGRRTAEECAAADPVRWAEIEPLLAVAGRISAPRLRPDPARKRLARYEFVEAMHRERAARHFPWGRLFVSPRLPRLALPTVLALFLAFAMATGGVAFAAQGAQPEDTLYGVKTAIEQVQVAAALSDEGKAAVEIQIAERRLDEVTRALETDQPAAAAKAAAGYEAAVASATDDVAKAHGQGKDVDAIVARLTANRDRQQAVLARVRGTAAPQAQDSLSKAGRGLDNAIEAVQSSGRADRDGAAGPDGTPDEGIAPGRSSEKSPNGRSGAPGQSDRNDGEGSATPQAGGESAQSAADAGALADLGALMATVEPLAGDPKVSGDSYRGLQAKLDAARSSLARGQAKAALNQIEAFQGQLDALRGAGFLAQARYDEISKAAAALVSDVKALPDDTGNGRKAAGGEVSPQTPAVGAEPGAAAPGRNKTPEAAATPTPRVNGGDRQGTGGKR